MRPPKPSQCFIYLANFLIVVHFILWRKHEHVIDQLDSTDRDEKASNSVDVHSGNVAISAKTINYRYPSTLPKDRARSDDLIMIVGVLSAADNFDARHSVRDTWKTHDHCVFFLIAGPWSRTVEHEFKTYGDIIWFDMVEDYYTITYKVQGKSGGIVYFALVCTENFLSLQ